MRKSETTSTKKKSVFDFDEVKYLEMRLHDQERILYAAIVAAGGKIEISPLHLQQAERCKFANLSDHQTGTITYRIEK